MHKAMISKDGLASEMNPAQNLEMSKTKILCALFHHPPPWRYKAESYAADKKTCLNVSNE